MPFTVLPPFQTRLGLHPQKNREITTKMQKETKILILSCCNSIGLATLLKVVPLLVSNHYDLKDHFDCILFLPFLTLFRIGCSPISVDMVSLEYSHTHLFT